jgi:acetoin utilization protein AcuC
MPQRQCVFVHSPEIEQYHYPPDSPFKTQRAAQTRALLISMGLFEGEGRREVAPVAATRAEAELFHTPAYLDILARTAGGDFVAADLESGLGTPETPVFRDQLTYAMLAAGASLTGARALLDGSADIAFNPSGGYHHAYADRAGGFCYINDVVLACRVLRDAGKRVFCLDLDAHHGNGTQAAFYGDPAVLTMSLHESGATLYPWGGFEDEIGESPGRGFNVNMPLPAGTDDDAFELAFRNSVLPLLSAYNPDVIVLELGMDVLTGDPLTHLCMTNNAFADVLPALLAHNKPMLVTGGGGYHPRNTARGWALAWTVLCGLEETNDEWVGMGGVFLGSSEWAAGLRDMKTYSQQQDHDRVHAEIRTSLDKLRRLVFPIHNILP